MSELSYEAIVAEMNKVAESKPVNNPYIYRYADLQIAIEVSAQVERERIIRLLQEPYWHNLRSPGTHEDCKMCETIWLINDRNIL